MLKKTLFSFVGLALLALPFAASAATITDLQAELASILQQIQLYSTSSAVVAVSGSGSGSLSGSVSGSVTSACPVISRSLSLGSTGNEVTALQDFLSANGYLNVAATGYFGALTKTAVGKWQVASGVTTSGNAGFGVFGPLSRNFFGQHCGSGGTTVTAQPFSADPSSGSAPLAVTFTTSDPITASSSYTVDFGDGATASMTKGSCIAITAIVGGQGGIRCSYSIAHTYSANGTYTAELLKQPSFTCPAGLMCAQSQSETFMLPVPQVVATQVITVGTSSTAGVNFSASPQSGAAPLTVQFTATAPQGTELGNTINFGDGSSGTLGVVPVCSSCSEEGVASHTYRSAGTYTATLTNNLCSCPANGVCNCPNIMILGTATVSVSGPNTGTTTANIQQLNAPGSVTLPVNGIAEIRNESFYFALNSVTASTATIQLTPVGCWNHFPSDAPPQIMCMIAMLPIPPQTLSIGQSYASSDYGITLTGIANNEATFSVAASSSSTVVY